MGRYIAYAVSENGEVNEAKLGEFDYLSDAITHIVGMRDVYLRDSRYTKACVRDATFGNSVVFEEFWK